MINTQDFANITSLRFETKALLKRAKKNPVIILNRSEPEAVILSSKMYNEYLSIIEDYYVSLEAEDFEKEDKSKVNWTSQKELEAAYE